MRSIGPMRAAKIGYITVSVLLCILGLVFMFMPNVSAMAIGIACGVMLIVFGIIRLVGYFSKDLFRLAFQYDLAFGILSIFLGILILLKPDNFFNFISIALGLSIFADGLFKIQIAFDSKKFGIKQWWLIFIEALVAGALGLILVFRPTESSAVLTVLLGVTVLAEGILNLSTVLAAVKIVENQKPDVIETEYYVHTDDNGEE